MAITLPRALSLQLLLAVLLASHAAVAAPGETHHTSSHFHNSRGSLHIDDDRLDWESDERSLALRNGTNGIVVARIRPGPQSGLHHGAVIVSVNGQPTTIFSDLFEALKRQQGHDVSLGVHDGGGHMHQARLAAADSVDWLPPRPLAPSPPGHYQARRLACSPTTCI